MKVSPEAGERVYHVLFLCTGNSARSLMAESLLERWGGEGFRSHSAGSHPSGSPHPLAIAQLERMNHDTWHLRSKSWDEFSAPEGPPLDFVFSVCDNARAETCPIFPGRAMRAHWGVEDPAAFSGPEEEARQLFHRIYLELESRIKLFASLPLESLDPLSLQERLDAIGKSSP